MISLFTLTTIFELKGRTKDGPALGLHTKTNLLLFAFVQNEDYIQCSVSDYMISFDFHVNFPDDFNLQKITRLLKNPEFAGYPPQLSYEETLDRKGLFCVSFSKG